MSEPVDKSQLLPFNSPCQACVSTDRELRFCESRCMPTGLSGYEPAARLGDQPHPHLHATCKRCGFEWLELTLGFKAGDE